MNTLVKKVDKFAWRPTRSRSPKLQVSENPITDLATPLTDIGGVMLMVLRTG